jgi:peptide deformylase
MTKKGILGWGTAMPISPDALPGFMVQKRLPILPLGDPRLREKTLPVPDPANPSVRAVANRLLGALRAFRKQHGFSQGIAAPQIGIAGRIMVVDPGPGPIVLVNPEVRWISDRTVCSWESCMCFPSLAVMVRRADAIRVAYRTLDGSDAVLASDIADVAAVIQHELDHLDGILLLDRTADTRSIISREAYAQDPDRFNRMCRDQESSRPAQNP